MCGEKFRAYAKIWNEWGSPPHVRGKAIEVGQFCALGGITPACAGKSRIRAGRGAAFGDHPPRMRGKVRLGAKAVGSTGITPAYAGKRLRSVKSCIRTGDHPRVCGEKKSGSAATACSSGSPPRMRGKVAVFCCAVGAHGITPAYAGKSHSATPCSPAVWDHPRVCGEKIMERQRPDRKGGSPPRMRGKAQDRQDPPRGVGITPAYAGKRGQQKPCTR